MAETVLPKSPIEIVKTLVFGSGAGIGAVIAYIVFDAVHSKPETALQIFGQVMGGSGALVIVLLVAIWFGNARIGEGLQVIRDNTEAQKDTALAQRDLADAVKAIADKDDRAAEEQRRLLNYVGSQNEKILEKLDAVISNSKSRSASA